MDFSGALDALETWSLATIGTDPIPNGSLPYGLSFADNAGGMIGLGIAKGGKAMHHFMPRWLGGVKTVAISTAQHIQLHKDMYGFLANKYASLIPKAGNTGQMIRQFTSSEFRINAIREFYSGPGAVYTDAAAAFFQLYGK